MFLKKLGSIFIFWHFAIFITFFINHSLGSDVIKRDLSLNRNNVPKNILATSMIGGTHLPHMLEILKILMDRGYNVTLISRGNYTAQSLNYRSIPQIIFDNEHFETQNSSNSVNASKNLNGNKFDATKTSSESGSHSKSDQSSVHKCTDIDNEFIDLSQNTLLSLIRLAMKSYVPSYIYNIFKPYVPLYVYNIFKQPTEEYTVDAIKSYVPFYNIYKQSAEELNADLFFCDYSINYPCFDIAWKLGKPAVGIFSDLYNIASSPYKADPVLGCRANMENESFYHRFKCTIVTPLIQNWRSIEFLKALNVQRTSIGIDPHWDMKGRISNLLMLSNNFFGFEIPSSDSPLHQEIGPIIPDNFPALTPVLDKFLIAHPRTIYFALGTNAILSSQNVVTILKSFLKLIDQDVIDGIIWSTTKTDPSETLSLTNSSVQISAILNNEHPHIHITKFSPQFAILSHENTKLFLSHGGAASSHESMYNAKPMLVLPIRGDQPRNAEMLELAGMALKLSKTNLKVDDIISKVKRLLNEESFKKNAERLQFLAKVNSKRKYRAADLIEIVLNTAKYEGVKDVNGGFKVDNENLLRDWITPDTRMGFIRGNNLDVYGTTIILFFSLSGGFAYSLWKNFRYFYIKYSIGNRISQKSLDQKKDVIE